MKTYGDSSNLRRKFSLQFQACFLRLFLLWAIEFLNQMTETMAQVCSSSLQGEEFWGRDARNLPPAGKVTSGAVPL